MRLCQLLLLARSPRLLRWRLETFGLYMPSLPGQRPWWRINPWVALTLLGQFPSYLGWLAQIQAVRQGGGPGWWHRRRTRLWEASLAREEEW